MCHFGGDCRSSLVALRSAMYADIGSSYNKRADGYVAYFLLSTIIVYCPFHIFGGPFISGSPFTVSALHITSSLCSHPTSSGSVCFRTPPPPPLCWKA